MEEICFKKKLLELVYCLKIYEFCINKDFKIQFKN